MAPPDGLEIRALPFDALHGWAEDDHSAARAAFERTCDALLGAHKETANAFDQTLRSTDAKHVFESVFQPVLVRGRNEPDTGPVFTGYFEPEYLASRRKTDRFCHPVYRLPPEMCETQPWLTRAEIHASGVLKDRGLEIAWLADPVEVFFLQVQGSGRLRLADGAVIRVGYAGKNGHPYQSVGQVLVRQGVFSADEISAQNIQRWARQHPSAAQALFNLNPSFVFFRELSDVPVDHGPLGTLQASLTPERSIAVDPAFVPLGAPVWIETAGKAPMRRLMIAQDTGSTIKGAQRADVFFGTGDVAGQAAGEFLAPGRMVQLWPKAWMTTMQQVAPV